MRLITFLKLILFSLQCFISWGQPGVSIEVGVVNPEFIGTIDGNAFVLRHPLTGQFLESNEYYDSEQGYSMGIAVETGIRTHWLMRLSGSFSLLHYESKKRLDLGQIASLGYWGVVDHRSHHLTLAPELVYRWKYGLQAGVGFRLIYNSPVEKKDNGEWSEKELELRHINMGPQISLRLNKIPFYLDIRYAWSIGPYYSEEINITDEALSEDFRMHQIHLGLGYYLLKSSK
jgi:hypothetical protein